jgi:hypothetical protein
MPEERLAEADNGGARKGCTCGGTLYHCGDGNFICDQCELEWFRCEYCSGSMQACHNYELVFLPQPVCLKRRDK